MAALINPGLRAELVVAASPDCPKGSLAQQVPVSPCNPAVPAGRQWCKGRD